MAQMTSKTTSHEMAEMSEVMFTNLLLLGLDVMSMEAKYKITFNKDMFNLPNKAGSEVVLHFLFNRLNPALCGEQFRDCWPVGDKKTEFQFRKVCNTWLTCIQKEELEAHLPRINASLLMYPGGRKFIHLLSSFSSFVLLYVMKMELGVGRHNLLEYPLASSNKVGLLEVTDTSLADTCCITVNKFFYQLHGNIAANRNWKQYANDLVKDYRGLNKCLRDQEHEKRQEVNVLVQTALSQGCQLPAKRSLNIFDSDRDVYAIRRGQRLEKVRSQWKVLNNFNKAMTEKRNIVRSILDRTASKHTVDAADIGIRVPGLLLRECQKEIQQREIDNVYVGGQLNLVSLLQLWNMCLKLYIQELQNENLPDVSSEIASLNSQAHKHHAYLMDLHALREEMSSETIEDLEINIAELRRTFAEQSHVEHAIASNENSPGLGLIAPTPPAPVLVAGPKSGETPTGPVASALPRTDTPEAIQSLSSSIEAGSRKIAKPRTHFSSFRAGNMSSTDCSFGMGTAKKQVRNTGENRKASGGTHTPRTGDISGTSSRAVKTPGIVKKGGRDGTVPGIVPNTAKRLPAAGANKNGIPPSRAAATIVPVKKTTVKPPKNSLHKALDLLADSIVDSVMHSDDSNERNFSMPSFENDLALEQTAFISRDLLKRSPQDAPGVTKESFGLAVNPTGDTPRSRKAEAQAFTIPVFQQTSEKSAVKGGKSLLKTCSDELVENNVFSVPSPAENSQLSSNIEKAPGIGFTHSYSHLDRSKRSSPAQPGIDKNDSVKRDVQLPSGLHSDSVNLNNSNTGFSSASLTESKTDTVPFTSVPSPSAALTSPVADYSSLSASAVASDAPRVHDVIEHSVLAYRESHQSDASADTEDSSSEEASRGTNPDQFDDRPPGDGEASTYPFNPPGRVVFGVDDSDDDPLDVSKLAKLSLLTSLESPLRSLSSQRDVVADSSSFQKSSVLDTAWDAGDLFAQTSGLPSLQPPSSDFLDLRDMEVEGLVDLDTTSPADTSDLGLDDSFAPVKGGILVDHQSPARLAGPVQQNRSASITPSHSSVQNSAYSRLDYSTPSKLLMAQRESLMQSQEGRSDPRHRGSPGRGSPGLQASDIRAQLAQLQAKVAGILNDSYGDEEEEEQGESDHYGDLLTRVGSEPDAFDILDIQSLGNKDDLLG